MQFEFSTSERILFGLGYIDQLGKVASEFRMRALLVTGRSQTRMAHIFESLEEHGVVFDRFSVVEEPTIEIVRDGIKHARSRGSEMIISVGGGSVLDVGKAVAALLTNGGDPLDYVEVIGQGKQILVPSAPFIAVPTTAGTGSEVTRNAVLASLEHRVKVSLRSRHMLPTIALVDPELTYSLPPDLTASTGMDALTQVLEPLVSIQPNPITDGLCREGLQRAAHSLERVYEDGKNESAREDMAVTSLFGGFALANAKLGAVHGFAGPIGGMYSGPHGAICAQLLPDVMEVNIRALRKRQPTSEVLVRYDEIGRILCGDPKLGADDGTQWVRRLREQLNIPSLGKYGLNEGDFHEVIDRASRSSSMKGNPIELTHEEMEEILSKAL
ncbi:MAG: iron-containing alcohol dehydrogenase [Anaerolineales bacterium]|nr:iron-containing alcohol dehydrogenase [Anaerolineales bacterium]